MSSRVLVVNDDLQASKPVISMLAARGYDVRTTTDADSAISSVRLWCPAVVIADTKIPLVDGIDLCQRVREISQVPIIVVSGNSDGRSEIGALDSGADDYLAKPFSAETLLARVRVAVRRSGATPESSALGVGEFHIDFNDRRVRVNGQPIRRRRNDLLVFMAAPEPCARAPFCSGPSGWTSGDQPVPPHLHGAAAQKLSQPVAAALYRHRTMGWVGSTGLVH
jgi:two-component system KDP operon response regulator KdpE